MPALLLAPLLACAGPESAPRDLDGVAHDAWVHYADGDEDALITDTRDLRGLLDPDALPLEGTFSDLTADEAAAAGFDGDPEVAAGLFVATRVGCTPEDLQAILASPDQMTLYPENYLAYERDYTADEEAFADGDIARLTWDGAYEVEIPLVGTYAAEIAGGVHHAEDGDDGPYLYSTTVMAAPAVTEPEALVFDVDLQLEMFFPATDEGMIHLFGMWRHIDRGGGLDTDNAGMQGLILDGLLGWDEDTTAICEEGRI